MNATSIVRALLRDYPVTRYDVTLAYLLYLLIFTGDEPRIEDLIGLATFLRTWQRHRRAFL